VGPGGRVLSSVVASQVDLHAEYAGVVPELASRAHVERIMPVLRGALAEAGAGLGMLDAIAVGHRPGLIGSLLVGVAAAKSLAWSLGKPLVGVDHVHAHLYAPALRSEGEAHAGDIAFPALGLVVSGGHTAMYHMGSWLDVRRLGATIDDALGEAYDKAATILGLGFPGGPAVDRLAQSPGANDAAVEFPVSRLGRESLDFSFSGLKTALLYAVRGVPGERAPPPPPPLTEARRADLAAGFQRAASAAVVLKLTRAVERMPKGAYRSLLTGGGVTANSRLRRELAAFAHQAGLDLRLPALNLCIDNAAMIAGLGREMLLAGRGSDLSLQAVPTSAL
jgi:N6-L-threonylcarbamoyladenine synthase